MKIAALVLAAAAALAAASCNVNEYCVNCASDAGGDVPEIDGGDGGLPIDAPVDTSCPPTPMAEICNDIDDDCDGTTDEDVPTVGTSCGTDTGECTTGLWQCTAGDLVCSGVGGAPEMCNTLDDDCDGTTDEGNPGGGQPCGSDLGDCVAGTTVCTAAGAIDCVGDIGTPGAVPETCDGHDNDCDGNFDEGLPPLGSCGATDVGECAFGTLTCVGGVPTCVGEVGPTLELCDTLDQDCDGSPTNGFNLDADPRNCGMCNRVCNLPFAVEGCAPGGVCTVAGCEPGHFNANGTPADGCEYACTFQGTQEACNQMDEDCDSRVDENLIVPTNLCDPDGACAGTVATCRPGGFDCVYGPNVSVDASGDIIPETRCDNIDNDCDGRVDEGHPLKGTACADNLSGVCQSRGTYVCNPADPTGPVICNITMPGGTSSAELCDNLDNDCNGVVDDNPAQDWVAIGGGREIMKWEASHPDATATSTGSLATRVCSRGGVLPWTSVTYPQARLACQSIGADLCTEQDWHRACSVVAKTAYPVTGPGASPATLFLEAEDYFSKANGTSGTVERSWVPDGAPAGFSGISALRASPNSGAAPTAAQAPTQSPRLDFQVNFAAADYYVWVRMYGPTNNDDAVHVGINATLPGTASTTALDLPTNATWTWVRSAAITVTAGNRFVSVWMAKDGVKVDAIVITRNNSTTPPAPTLNGPGGTWSYASMNTTYQLGVCNEDDFDTGAAAGDQDDLLVGGSRPNCYANWGGANRIHDLSGNAKEWTLSRVSAVNPIRGGASNNEGTGITCDLAFTSANDTFFFPNVGFRCCR